MAAGRCRHADAGVAVSDVVNLHLSHRLCYHAGCDDAMLLVRADGKLDGAFVVVLGDGRYPISVYRGIPVPC